MAVIDQQLVVRQLTEKIDKTSSGRHRTMLERIREHAIAESAGSLEGLMATLGSSPAYHFWEMQGDTGPKGRDGVAAYYSSLVENKLHVFEYDCGRIIVDDDHVVLEAVIRMVRPGAELVKMGIPGFEVDPAGHYLMCLRSLVLWPFDEDLMIVGEDSYSGGPMEIRLLTDDELPDSYKALFAPV